MSQGKETQDHLIHIFVHGVLHLLGFDHEEHTSAEQMESLEIRILEKIGVADPY
jgi:probable rRNA maturation factor